MYITTDLGEVSEIVKVLPHLKNKLLVCSEPELDIITKTVGALYHKVQIEWGLTSELEERYGKDLSTIVLDKQRKHPINLYNLALNKAAEETNNILLKHFINLTADMKHDILEQSKTVRNRNEQSFFMHVLLIGDTYPCFINIKEEIPTDLVRIVKNI